MAVGMAELELAAAVLDDVGAAAMRFGVEDDAAAGELEMEELAAAGRLEMEEDGGIEPTLEILPSAPIAKIGE
jgi:hypothetical protein